MSEPDRKKHSEVVEKSESIYDVFPSQNPFPPPPFCASLRLGSPNLFPPVSRFILSHLVLAETPADQAQPQQLRHPHGAGNVRRGRTLRLARLRTHPAAPVLVSRGCRRHRNPGGLRQRGRIVRSACVWLILGGLVHCLHLDPVGVGAHPAEQQGATVLPKARLLQIPKARLHGIFTAKYYKHRGAGGSRVRDLQGK